MPRLIPPERGNGKRPSSPEFKPGAVLGSGTSVVVLDVSDETHEFVGERHDAALDPDDDTTLLTGTIVQVDNPRPVDGTPGHLTVYVGGSTIHEAATEVIECIAALAGDMPEWLAATDPDLGEVVAEHFTVKGYSNCKAIALDEVTA